MVVDESSQTSHSFIRAHLSGSNRPCTCTEIWCCRHSSQPNDHKLTHACVVLIPPSWWGLTSQLAHPASDQDSDAALIIGDAASMLIIAWLYQ